MFESIGELVHLVFRIIIGVTSFLLEVVYEIVDCIYSLTKGHKRARWVITVLVFLAVLGLLYWWFFH